MDRMKALCVSLAVIGMTACATTGDSPRESHGTLTETAGKPLPPGFTAAVIYEIDGERVFYGRGRHYVTPGQHTVRVWPEQTGPLDRTPIPGAHAQALGVQVKPLVINVQAGARYYLAAVVRRHRVFAQEDGTVEPLGPWRTTILPVIVRDTET